MTVPGVVGAKRSVGVEKQHDPNSGIDRPEVPDGRGTLVAMAQPAAPIPRMKVRISPDWPGPVTLRRSWAKAIARPWNDKFADAHLRIIRGRPGFTRGCAETLLEAGAPSAISPPLPHPVQQSWLRAGFESHIQLALLRLELDDPLAAPDHLVAPGTAEDLDAATKIDAEAFTPFWRLDRLGLEEAMLATSRSVLLIIRDPDNGVAGFGIVGLGPALAYLQRVAVAPQWQRQGMGRSLVRASARHARSQGARALLLNTQLDNVPAFALYELEGFSVLTDALDLMRFPPESATAA
jgi:ribosomal protein S18 acetylase RimI-like enzyme